MSLPQNERAKVFISYSRKDGEWLERVQVHLKDLVRQGMVDVWDDTKLQTGTQWRDEINNALNSARAAILLISADFIASDFIADNELPPLLARAEENGVVILPLILSPSRFGKIESLSRFMTVNPPSYPLIELNKGEQERYLVKLSEDVLHAIEETPALLKADEKQQPRIFSVPYLRNRFFTGRDDILTNLHTGFNKGERVQALSGMPGVGKTQTAIEYAYRNRPDYQYVFWCKAHSRETLLADLASIANLLELPQKENEDQSVAVGAVKRWLENNDRWLLILDNADEVPMASEFIPSSETGHILLTTRASHTGSVVKRRDVVTMGSEDGALFLLQRIGRLEKGAAIEAVPEGLRKQAQILSEAVGGLPLALDQAAAFIDENRISPEKYLALYRNEQSLLSQPGNDSEDQPSLTSTFSLAFRKVEEASPTAADLLRVCAFLEADAIPEEIFSKGAEDLGDFLSLHAANSLSLNRIITEAGRFSLLQRNPDANTISLHRLVQDVLKSEMDEATQREWIERAVCAVSRTFPNAVDYSNWGLCGRLIPHAQILISNIEKFTLEFPEVAFLMNQMGHYLKERGQYTEAVRLLERALAIREKVLGAEHSETGQSLNNLAELYLWQGRYKEAEPLLERALAIGEKVLGAEHSNTASSLNNLAGLYNSQGKYEKAEPLFERALAIKERVLGAEHPDTAMSLNNLAALYNSQGKYAQAEPLLERALAIKERVLGPEHPETATGLNNLAELYNLQGKYAKAEPLLERAVAINEKVLGAEHPKTGKSLNNLAELYLTQGKSAKAEPLFERARAIGEKVLGAEHPDTAMSLNNLAALYTSQGKYEKAEPLLKRAVAILEKVLGAEHPDTATGLSNLAMFYHRQGNMLKAEPIYKRALAIYQKALGWEHPDLVKVLLNYAQLLRSMHRGFDAGKLEARAKRIQSKQKSQHHA